MFFWNCLLWKLYQWSYMFFAVTAIITFKILNLVISKIVSPHHRLLVCLGVSIVGHFSLNTLVLQDASP